MTQTAERAAQVAEANAAKMNAPQSLEAIANLIRHAKGPSGWDWIATNCEQQAKHQERDDHAAQFRIVAKRLRRAIAEVAA